VNGSRGRLLELLRELSFERRKVTLASGRESDFFIDCKQTVLTAEGHALVGRLMYDDILLLPVRAEAVAGVELGGCPLASAVAIQSWHDRVVVEGETEGHAGATPLDAIYVRKDAKDHGSKRLIEGGTRLPRGTHLAIVEDVITTGGSTLKARDKLVAAGFAIAGVVALVDRLEGGREALEAEGLAVRAITSRADFLP
jgi:orotate phosphoribosyltransferase